MHSVLTVDLDKVSQNVCQVKSLCDSHNLEVTGVTKVFQGMPEIAETMVNQGVSALGDVHVENLKRLSGLRVDRWMIRIPSLSEAKSVVENAELSLNSDLATIKELNRNAGLAGKKHKVILMADLGDLREGFINHDEILYAADSIQNTMPYLDLAGLGTNLTCFSFVQSDCDNLSRLVGLAERLGLPDPIISGGNSATINLMLKDGIPEGITNLRLGESLLFGRERSCYRYLEGTSSDAFILRVEIAECREKPSMPMGIIGKDSYGNTPFFKDRGLRKRAICAVGRQSIDDQTMWPLDPGVEILGASSDHLVLDVTDSETEYQSGDCIEFRLGYFAVMRAFSTRHVKKVYRSRVKHVEVGAL